MKSTNTGSYNSINGGKGGTSSTEDTRLSNGTPQGGGMMIADYSNNNNNTSNNDKNQSFSNTSLEYKLRHLRDESLKHSQLLTQRLAASQSGQNLLHMGTSLSALPPTLHQIVTNLHPVLAQTDMSEKKLVSVLDTFVEKQHDIQSSHERVDVAKQLSILYNDLVTAETIVMKHQKQQQKQQQQQQQNRDSQGMNRSIVQNDNGDGDMNDDDTAQYNQQTLDSASALERASYISLSLVRHLYSANEVVTTTAATMKSSSYLLQSGVGKRSASTSSNNSTSSSTQVQQQSSSTSNPSQGMIEYSQFIVRLAPRIRRIESDIVACLCHRIERTLQQLQKYKQQQEQQKDDEHDQSNTTSTTNGKQQQQLHQEQQNNEEGENNVTDDDNSNKEKTSNVRPNSNIDVTEIEMILLLILGHCMRSMTILGRSKDVESMFARVAVVPIIRSKLSMGSLDEGGARGECKGLHKLLTSMLSSVISTYGSLLSFTECSFLLTSIETNKNDDDNNNNSNSDNNIVEIDLITAGVWVPIVTSLMADSAIRMAIFSPGIASIVQSNYRVLDAFVSQLARSLLGVQHGASSATELISSQENSETTNHYYKYYYRPNLTKKQIMAAQNRIDRHAKTAEFMKKWNLPIYYQLRFGECCTRLNKAIDQTRKQGWIASDVYTGTAEDALVVRSTVGFELGLFVELYDILLGLWKPDVILIPLTNRFLRGAIQLIGRVVAFITEGMDGEILFGDEPVEPTNSTDGKDEGGKETENGSTDTSTASNTTAPRLRKSYCWGESEGDVAAVAWELEILDSTVRHDYTTIICDAIRNNTNNDENADNNIAPSDAHDLVKEVLVESSMQICNVIDKAWNGNIVKILTAKCSGPLVAVKGIAATYRMTNRPAPTQSSPFVSTILRPLKEFDTEFTNRIPERIGYKWKQQIVATVTERYSNAVEELILTVQRTEEALKNRKTRRVTASGNTSTTSLTDGEKVKLQLYLDYETYSQNVRDVGLEPATIIGLSKLQELTVEGKKLLRE